MCKLLHFTEIVFNEGNKTKKKIYTNVTEKIYSVIYK